MAEETITEVADAPKTITAEAPIAEAPVVEQAAVEAPVREVRVDRNTKPVAFDKDALASRIKDKFADTFKDEGDELTDDEPAAVEAENKAPVAGELEAKVETTPEAVEEAAAPSNAPTLPASYRRSLKAYEWTDEEIDANLKALGPAFINSAAKIHATRAKEVSQWAEMGRQARANAPAPQANQKQADEAALQPLDPKALKAKYGDEALIDDIVTPINQTIERMNKMMPTIQQHQKQAEQANLETLDRQVRAFFGGKELEPYKEVYGANDKLSNEHFTTRMKVIQHADMLIGGARMQGVNLSLDEALTLAHDSVTAPIKSQAAKADLAAKLTARSKSITMRPNTRGPAAGSVAQGVAKTRGEMENRVKLGLSKIFN